MWLSIEAVTFAYGHNKVLGELRLAVPGKFPIMVVVGPSGVGKTTLIKLLAGHLVPQRGTVTVCGETVTRPSASRPVVFQDHNLFPWLTVVENIEFGLKCQGMPAGERKKRTRHWVERLRLEGVESYYPAMLSGGMQQRVGLARAMVVQPKCVLMDEPFSALDIELRESLALIISELSARTTKFVIVTHDLHDAVFLGSRIVAISGGDGLVSYDLEHPQHPRQRSFRHSHQFNGHLANLKRVLELKEDGNS